MKLVIALVLLGSAVSLLYVIAGVLTAAVAAAYIGMSLGRRFL